MAMGAPVTLLRGNRITVHQPTEGRDYRIEGVAELTLEAHTAGRPETTSVARQQDSDFQGL
jgi:hypothetical protein